VSSQRGPDGWTLTLEDTRTGAQRTIFAKVVVNAAGPWVADVLRGRLGSESRSAVRLVKGSHILVPRLWESDTFRYGEIDNAYILQQEGDGRVVFALPYGDHCLIGTTDVPVDRPEDAVVSAEEIRYLCDAANAYFVKQTAPGDLIWSYAGIRSLYDDGASSAKDVTRDYHLELDGAPGPKLLSVFGGKITTARALALEALDRLGIGGLKFTTNSALPGGNLSRTSNESLRPLLKWMPVALIERLAYAYGTRIDAVIGGANALADLGRHFGAGLYEAEVRYLIDTEFARTADDIIWRRTKLGLVMTKAEQAALASWIAARTGGP
jgi:glycerol-3-phosphate dehydrogenase